MSNLFSFIMIDINGDETIKSPNSVTPVKIGVQNPLKKLDSDFRQNDKKADFRLFTISLMVVFCYQEANRLTNSPAFVPMPFILRMDGML
ncbi:MAG: hypothetical protein C4522_06995 [Desulfobacteraceae bacterium]|nr:MAG: hypothetical protein C4522_06995 [Desulfobacteraceae bacterium]